jgi:hypothetical protein
MAMALTEQTLGVESAPGRVLLVLELSAHANAVLEDLAARFGTDKADVLRTAVGLLKLAMDARAEGKWVGAGEPDQDLDTEFVGF